MRLALSSAHRTIISHTLPTGLLRRFIHAWRSAIRAPNARHTSRRPLLLLCRHGLIEAGARPEARRQSKAWERLLRRKRDRHLPGLLLSAKHLLYHGLLPRRVLLVQLLDVDPAGYGRRIRWLQRVHLCIRRALRPGHRSRRPGRRGIGVRPDHEMHHPLHVLIRPSTHIERIRQCLSIVYQRSSAVQ